MVRKTLSLFDIVKKQFKGLVTAGITDRPNGFGKLRNQRQQISDLADINFSEIETCAGLSLHTGSQA